MLPTPPTTPRGCQPPSAKLSGSWHCMQGERASGVKPETDYCKHTLPGCKGCVISTTLQSAQERKKCPCFA